MRSCAPRSVIWPTIKSNPSDPSLFSARAPLHQRPP
jgi:hypothetical protein